ncbi:MAG TPA: TonB-dependent receptor, partial [Opitutaceae bacterium]|nr:TonB-dependent receptor [Opitutaceae bacterium]
TYLDAKVLADQGRGQFGSAVGKTLPNIPDWRMTFVATYRIGRKWSFTAAGRYSGKLYTTLDNNDVNPNTYQGFSAFFVADARVHCQIDRHWAASLGVDNILNRKYFFFHPFPQRTVIADLKYDF